MKEKIVIEDEFWVKHFQEREKDFYEEDLCSGGNPEEWWHYEKEQVPETFEELKELCKTTDYIRTANIKNIPVYLNEFGTGYIIIKGLYFGINGKIFYEVIGQRYVIGKNKTPQQMWQIIKSLIGEE